MMRVVDDSFQNSSAVASSSKGSSIRRRKSRTTVFGSVGSSGSGQWLICCIINVFVNKKSQLLDDEELAYQWLKLVEVVVDVKVVCSANT